MKFIEIKEEDVNVINKDVQLNQIKEEYKDLFSGLGCFPGEYDI